MKFPLVSDIASTTVSTISIKAHASTALEVMIEENHRNVIVIDKNNIFRVLTVVDILSLQSSHTHLDIELSTLNLSQVPSVNKDQNILDTLEYLNEDMEYICVTNSDGTLYGLVTHTDITSNIDPDTLMDNYTLSDFLKESRRMKWVTKDTSTSDILQDMLKGSFDNVVIVEKMIPLGILTTKDVMQLIKNKNNLNVEISNYMSSPVETINQDSSIRAALEFVKQKHYKRVLVVDAEGRLSGIITQKELISLSYSRWALLMKEYQEELSEINNMLEYKNKEYEALASTDPLTGLYNRYKFSELYLLAYNTMIEKSSSLSLIFLDIDFFKNINDIYGHNTGDQVLIQISAKLVKILRSIDIICRWGGEEFLILLPTAILSDATLLAQKIRGSIEALEIENIGNVTVSLGVSQVVENDTMEQVINRADKALYLAKDSGRNCVKTELDL